MSEDQKEVVCSNPSCECTGCENCSCSTEEGGCACKQPVEE